MAANHCYDLILLDLNMPQMDGFEGARRIRAAQGEQKLLVALTASTGDSERKLAKECGFDEFLAKPVNGDKLVSVLVHLLLTGKSTSPSFEYSLPTAGVGELVIPAGLEHLMPIFLAEMKVDVQLLLDVAQRGDRAALADHAHAMRGKCAMFGEESMFTLLGEVEEGAESLERAQIHHLCAMINGRAIQLGVHDRTT